MKLWTRTIGLSIAALVSLSAVPALADQADKDACVGLAEGDDCTRGDGSAGTCIPDESDASVLTCDDDGGGGSGGGGGDDSSSGGCSSSGGGAPAGLPFAFFAMAALAGWRRKKG